MAHSIRVNGRPGFAAGALLTVPVPLVHHPTILIIYLPPEHLSFTFPLPPGQSLILRTPAAPFVDENIKRCARAGGEAAVGPAGLCSLPALVSLRLLNVKNSILQQRRGAPWEEHLERQVKKIPFPNTDIFLEPWLLSEQGPQTNTSIRRMFDMMWQAYDWARCFNYDENGERIDSR